MIHPALQLALRHPELLAEHGSAYAALLAAGLSQDGQRLRRQLLCQVTALALLAVGGVLAGVAVMLWSTQTWVWLLVPAVPLLGAGLLWLAQGRTAPGNTLTELGRQLTLDAEWLRHAGQRP
ncbi:hypothetical protein [Hydrogenophaga sp. IBVHS2]|uniref:hypothetical protein n=1 Tax=Hydrogenophaga sp. IBVHS2 TaxID=1985170 RepID=UPI000A2E301E|nr:hypothetical protein [Hydrogenophaga sp. IBVHS2]OSZ65808.1 hypothetical protein CAP38_07110 [Hydrogenophaga sp. IBVHS2]